jgi:hypothetical protein
VVETVSCRYEEFKSKYLNCTYANGVHQWRTMTDDISIQQSAKIINTSHNFHIIVTLHLTTNLIHTIYHIETTTTTTMTTNAIHTMMDKKMESSMHLSAIGEVIPDATKVLLNAVSAMQDKSISRTNLLKHASTLKKLIVPLLQQTSVDVKEASQSLGPILSVGYAHQREQNKRKQATKLQTTLTSKEEENIFVFLQDKTSNDDDEEKSPSKRPRHSIATPSPQQTTDDVLPPLDRAYDRAEVAKILSTTRANTKQRGELQRKIIKHQKQFGVPCHRCTLSRLMNAFEKGKLIYGDFVMGRPPLMTNKEIEEAINHFQKRNGASLTKEDVRQIICKERNSRLEAAGFKVLDDNSITGQSVANYTAYIAIQPGMSIAASTTVKTSTRYAAENSIRGAISLLSIIASTHFVPVNEEDPET